MSYQEQLATQYAETRARLLGRPPARPKAVPLEMPAEPVIVALPVARPPEPRDPSKPLNPPLADDAPAWLRIAHEVSEKHRVSFEDMRGKSHVKRFVAARSEAYFRIRTETALSYPQIGRRFGGRDHTTVLHGVRRFTGGAKKLTVDELQRLQYRANRLRRTLATVVERIAALEQRQ